MKDDAGVHGAMPGASSGRYMGCSENLSVCWRPWDPWVAVLLLLLAKTQSKGGRFRDGEPRVSSAHRKADLTCLSPAGTGCLGLAVQKSVRQS